MSRPPLRPHQASAHLILLADLITRLDVCAAAIRAAHPDVELTGRRHADVLADAIIQHTGALRDTLTAYSDAYAVRRTSSPR